MKDLFYCIAILQLGNTALIIASINDHLKIADYLIQNGADIDKKGGVFKDLFF